MHAHIFTARGAPTAHDLVRNVSVLSEARIREGWARERHAQARVR
jgi:hypothetical protein